MRARIPLNQAAAAMVSVNGVLVGPPVARRCPIGRGDWSPTGATMRPEAAGDLMKAPGPSCLAWGDLVANPGSGAADAPAGVLDGDDRGKGTIGGTWGPDPAAALLLLRYIFLAAFIKDEGENLGLAREEKSLKRKSVSSISPYMCGNCGMLKINYYCPVK